VDPFCWGGGGHIFVITLPNSDFNGYGCAQRWGKIFSLYHIMKKMTTILLIIALYVQLPAWLPYYIVGEMLNLNTKPLLLNKILMWLVLLNQVWTHYIITWFSILSFYWICNDENYSKFIISCTLCLKMNEIVFIEWYSLNNFQQTKTMMQLF